MKSIKTTRNLALVTIAIMGVLAFGMAVAHASEAAVEGGIGAKAGVVANLGVGTAPFYAAALVMGVSCLSAAYAVGKVGAAALGAAAEKPELLGKAIVFVGLGEGIAIFGLIISLMLINKIP